MGPPTRLPAPTGDQLLKRTHPVTSREVKLNSLNPSDAENPDSAAYHPRRCLSSTDTSAPDLRAYAVLQHHFCTCSETPRA